LRGYSDALTPWAEQTARKMLLEVNARDLDYWRSLSNGISVALGQELRDTPIGERLRELMAGQVALITSLPIEAGQRVHDLTIKSLETSARANQIDDEIRRSGEVCENRATLIARTEVARTASVLTQTRAEAAGSTHYTWQTSEDGTVRPGHRAMDGQVCAWASPPEVKENDRVMHFHPGTIWNCRCWCRPILPS
jgi:SPP1 gp7 family putative phage head morphogenesis protein